MDWQDIFHWVYIAGMAIGALYFASLGSNPRGIPKFEYFIATFIPIWSGLAYLSMVLPHNELEQGKIEVAGQIAHFARYADWIVTTPLLLVALSWTAMHYLSHKDWTLIFSLMASQVIVVLSGLIADLSVIPWVRYFWFTVGVVAFLIVMWGIWNPLRAKTRSQGPELSEFYDRLTTFFTATWVLYPIVWILGPSGFRVFDQNVDTFLFCLIPFFSKVVFSFLDLNGLRSLGGRSAETGAEQFTSRTLQFLGNVTALWKPQRPALRRRW